MANQSNPLAVATGQEVETLSSLLKKDSYANRFKEVLGERSAQFCSSLISIGNTLGDVAPRSIIGSAMTAACLDLPIDKNLGFAWIVPYKGVATFQMGYKGYIQLGMRSAQYKRMNATSINREVWKGYDMVGEPVLDWEQYDPAKEIWGYFFGFELINGFTKTAVWTKEKVHEHATKYSQSYRAGKDIWKTQFDGMALKTVIANTLRKWGPMSVQMQRAFQSDSAVIRDIDATPEYIEGDGAEKPEKVVEEHPEQKKQREAAEKKSKVKEEPKKEPAPTTTAATTPPEDEKELAKQGLAPAKEAAPVPPGGWPKAEPPTNVVPMPDQTKQSKPEEKKPEPAPIPVEATVTPTPAVEPTPAPAPAAAATTPENGLSENQAKFKQELESAGITFEEFASYAAGKFLPKKADPTFPKSWAGIDETRATLFLRSIKGLIIQLKKVLKK